ncbi:MAG TPA: hypothetical protein VH637_16605 [Streptosporangiaceae bacterium]|jgi:hypothetical protein
MDPMSPDPAGSDIPPDNWDGLIARRRRVRIILNWSVAESVVYAIGVLLYYTNHHGVGLAVIITGFAGTIPLLVYSRK